MIELNEQSAKSFLAKNGIKNSKIKKIAGDASFRSYYRIFVKESGEEKKYVLMYAPPSHEDTKPFVRIDEFLVVNGFSAPKIFSRDEENGFLLLEDFGDDSYSRVLAKDSNQELELYKKACDCLIQLHAISPNRIKDLQGLSRYNHALFFREVNLFLEWYLPQKGKKITLQEKADFKSLWFELFDLLSKEDQVLVLRDYHADNLMFLPNMDGYKQVGLLDFQDAVIGSKAYDLVSLLEDARRDVDEKNREKILKYFLEKSGSDKSVLLRDYEILSLQRNIKILGIFSRLSLRDGKHAYLKLLPRVLNFVETRLCSKNLIFSEIGKFLKTFL